MKYLVAVAILALAVSMVESKCYTYMLNQCKEQPGNNGLRGEKKCKVVADIKCNPAKYMQPNLDLACYAKTVDDCLEWGSTKQEIEDSAIEECKKSCVASCIKTPQTKPAAN